MAFHSLICLQDVPAVRIRILQSLKSGQKLVALHRVVFYVFLPVSIILLGPFVKVRPPSSSKNVDRVPISISRAEHFVVLCKVNRELSVLSLPSDISLVILEKLRPNLFWGPTEKLPATIPYKPYRLLGV